MYLYILIGDHYSIVGVFQASKKDNPDADEKNGECKKKDSLCGDVVILIRDIWKPCNQENIYYNEYYGKYASFEKKKAKCFWSKKTV
jgi:hypothetical protein